MNKFIIFAFILTIGTATVYYFKNSLKETEAKVHYHAGFLVYKDGILEDFSNIKYMHIEPCNDKPGKTIKEDDQEEKAHLHENVGDVVHVHRNGAVWGDLFRNIKYHISNIKDLKGYINGKPVANILSYPIKPYDSTIFIIGDQSKVDLNKYVTKEHIVEVEKKSEDCGK